MDAMAGDMNTELVCVMATLGYHDEDAYYKGADCIESLKDLIRFLRREDETCNIRRQMGYAHLLQKDLIPMLIHLGDDRELVDIVIRLLVNLTSPADICFNKMAADVEETSAKEKMTSTFQTKHIEVITYLQAYKLAFTDKKSMAAIGSQMGRILQMEWEDRGDDELLLFERLLLLLRNILHVPSNPEEEKRTDDDASLHDQILWNMHLNGIDDLLIYISSSPEESRWAMHVIEVINLMLREQNPEKLSKSSEDSSSIEKAEDTKLLLSLKEKEEVKKNAANQNKGTSRHSRFGGSYWVVNMKGVGNTNTLVHHKHVVDPNGISFDEKKYPRRIPKRRQPPKETEVERKSTLKIRLFLKEFCKKFLELSYNPMMRIVKDTIIGKKSQDNDDTYYIWAMRFFMIFNRTHSFKVEFVSETLNMNAFHYILKQINLYYDQFLMHKRGGWEAWSKRLCMALQAYKELLLYIASMDQSNDEVLKDASSVIKNNIFYHEEYRSIFIVLIRSYSTGKYPHRFLSDLIDTFHIFLKLLENFCKTRGTLLVKSKKKIAKKRKQNPLQTTPSSMTATQLDEIWENNLAPSLSGILQGYETLMGNSESPFDPLSDVPVDEQKVNAMIRIQDLLRIGQSGEAVLLLRASRECWPEEEKFGLHDMAPEVEFDLFRNLLTLEIERPIFDEEVTREEVDDDDEEEEAISVRSVEREFHLKSFLMSLASPHIIQPYSIQLKKFRTNSTFTNHAVVKIMHRVAVDLHFPEMLFQLSLFGIFNEILLEGSYYKELAKFSQYIINKFTESAIANPKIYVETLFWKGTGDCYQISSREAPKDSEKVREKWTLEEEEELKSLFYQYKEADDVVDKILKNISDGERTRRKITNKLVRLRLIDSSKDLPNTKKACRDWTSEQEQELKTLFDQHKEAEDVVGEILNSISGERTRRKIIKMLVRLQLIENAKQLPKPLKQKISKWTEEQTEELHRLFEEYKNTDDILGNILVSISFKKSKHAVTKHLVETGKADREMLRKKRKNKNIFQGMINNEDGSDDEKIYDEYSDEEDVALEAEHLNNNITIKDSLYDSDDVSMPISDLLYELKEDGFSQQIIWLQTRLLRAAEDRDEDCDWYPMPLLTLTEEDDLALENNKFKKLLKAIELRPPFDEQESFWRIPEKLNPGKLRKFANEISDILNSTDGPSRDIKLLDESAAGKQIGEEVSIFNSNHNNKDDCENENILRKSIKRKRILDEDSSDDDGNTDATIKNTNIFSQEAGKDLKRKRIVEENYDSDGNGNEAGM